MVTWVNFTPVYYKWFIEGQLSHVLNWPKFEVYRHPIDCLKLKSELKNWGKTRMLMVGCQGVNQPWKSVGNMDCVMTVRPSPR